MTRRCNEFGELHEHAEAALHDLRKGLRDQVAYWRDEAREDRQRGDAEMAEITRLFAKDIEDIFVR